MAKGEFESSPEMGVPDPMALFLQQQTKNEKIPQPTAPISPTAKGSREVAIASMEERERIRKAFSHQKTVLSRSNTNNDNAKRTSLG